MVPVATGTSSGWGSVTRIEMGAWATYDLRRAHGVLDELHRVSVADQRQALLTMLLCSAAAFVAAMGWGRFVTVQLDADGVIDGNYNADNPLQIDWSLVPTLIYTFAVIWFVFFVMYRLQRYGDRGEWEYQRWLAAMEQQRSDQPAVAGADELEAERFARYMHAQYLSQFVTNFSNGWTYSSMFMWTVLIHSFEVGENLSPDLPSMLVTLSCLHFVCMALALTAHALPMHCAKRAELSLNRERLNKVADAFCGTMAWLLAIHWMELVEVVAAHATLSQARQRQLIWYWGGYHGLPPVLRWAISGVVFATAALLLLIERRCTAVDKRTMPTRRRSSKHLSKAFVKLALDETVEAVDLTDNDGDTLRSTTACTASSRPACSVLHELLLKVITNLGAVALLRAVETTFTPSSWLIILRDVSASLNSADVAEDWLSASSWDNSTTSESWMEDPFSPVPAHSSPRPPPAAAVPRCQWLDTSTSVDSGGTLRQLQCGVLPWLAIPNASVTVQPVTQLLFWLHTRCICQLQFLVQQ